MPKSKSTTKKIKRMRPRGIKPMEQNEFLETMGRLELIDEEIKKEKEYLKNRFKKKRN